MTLCGDWAASVTCAHPANVLSNYQPGWHLGWHHAWEVRWFIKKTCPKQHPMKWSGNIEHTECRPTMSWQAQTHCMYVMRDVI